MRTNRARTAAGFAAEGGEGGVIRQTVSRALSLKPRGGIGNDGLVVRSLSARLRVELLARRIHPWDRDRPANERAELFVQQCLEDVSTAIPELFRAMPEIDDLEVAVLDPRDRTVLIAGVVNRKDVLASKALSPGMKLRAMGLVYRRDNSGFEPIEGTRVFVVR